jgi:hypothetical protein
MANAFTNFLGQVVNSPTQLKDYSHASRLYVDDYFRLAPKAGFLYYVVFNINRNNNPIISQFLTKNGPELGLLVKGTDLPKYRMSTETVNQYNRKAIVQSKIDYQPVTMTFHDDHNNTTTGLWKSYYNYYFVDGVNTSGLNISPGFADTKYKKIGASLSESTSFGLNNGQTDPFFRSIEIYQLNRKQFTAFILVNPIITDFSHDSLDQTQSKFLENKMTIQYETVLYGTGKVKKDSPTGFATIHYDTTPGPLSIFGGGNNSILGPGGIIPGIGEVFGGAGDTSPLGLLKSARGATNIFNNMKNVSKASILSEGYGILDKIARTGKLPDVLSGSSPAGLALATLPGEKPTTAIPRSAQAGGGGFSLGGIGAGVAGAVGGLTDKLSSKLRSIGNRTTSATASEITSQQAQQAALAGDLQNQISKNTELKNELNVRVAAANGDQDKINAIYAEYDGMGYTDPDKLSATLQTVQLNQEQLDQQLKDAVSSESSNTELLTAELDTTTNGSENSVTSIADNQDAQLTTNNVFTQNEDNSTTSYFV